MSRYSYNIKVDGVEHIVSYGYDNPLCEYFIHVSLANPPADDEDDGLLFAVSNFNTMKCHPKHPNKLRWGKGELLDLFIEWGVPDEHREALAMDEQF